MSICTFPVQAQNSPGRMVKELRKRLFNATVYIKLRVCFTFAKYENDTCLYVRQPMCLLMHICYSKIHLHQLGSFILIKTMLNSLNVL